MYIQQFGNFLVNRTNGNFQVNKYNQNPINFRGKLNSDTVEITTEKPVETRTSGQSLQEREKQEVLKKFDDKLSELKSSKIAAAAESRKLEISKIVAFNMLEDEEFSTQIDDALFTYLEETSRKKGFYDLEDLVRKRKITESKRAKALTEIISTNFPEYMKQIEQGTDVLSVAKTVRKECKEIVETTNPDRNFSENFSRAVKGYEDRYSTQVEQLIKDNIEKSLLDTAGKSTHDFKFSLATKFDSEIKKQNAEVSYCEKSIETYTNSRKKYLEQFELDPITASYYDPFLYYTEKVNRLLNTGVIVPLSCINYPSGLLEDMERSGVLQPFGKEGANRLNQYRGLYDVRDKRNKQVLDAIVGKEGKLLIQTDVARQYSVPNYIIDNLPIEKLHYDLCDWRGNPKSVTLVDTSDEKTIQTLEEESVKWAKTRSKRSKYAFTGFDFACEEKEIPATYLAKLGFGSVQTLRKLVEQGELSGKVEAVQTESGIKYKTTLDSSDTRLPKVLVSLRDQNKAITKHTQLAKEIGVSQKQLVQDIADGKLDIIDEHIFNSDSDYKYIDKRTDKNRSYIEQTMFEKELARQLKQQQNEQRREELKQKRIQRQDALSRFNSLRMSLVWHFCPNTKAIASNMAVRDGHLCQLLVKDSEDEDALTRREQIKVDSYRKEMWRTAGTDELKEGNRKANEVLRQLKENGLASIEDSEVRKILEDYGFIL